VGVSIIERANGRAIKIIQLHEGTREEHFIFSEVRQSFRYRLSLLGELSYAIGRGLQSDDIGPGQGSA
jgi:hypothetical protein